MTDYSIPGLMTPELKTKSGTYHEFSISRDPFIVIPIPLSFKDTSLEDINFRVFHFNGERNVTSIDCKGGDNIFTTESEEIPSGKLIKIFWGDSNVAEQWSPVTRDFRVQIFNKDNSICSLVFLKIVL